MRVNYFQQGGQAQAANVQKQVEALVQAAMSGDQKATQQVNQILEAAKAGDQQAAQLAQMIQVVAQKLQGQATMNKWGSKLTYIRSLKYAKGGKHTCPACEQKVEMKKCGGKKAKKHQFGGPVGDEQAAALLAEEEKRFQQDLPYRQAGYNPDDLDRNMSLRLDDAARAGKDPQKYMKRWIKKNGGDYNNMLYKRYLELGAPQTRGGAVSSMVGKYPEDVQVTPKPAKMFPM